METADFEQQMQMSQRGLLKMVFSLTRQQTQFRYEIVTLMKKNVPKATWQKFSLELQMIIREM